MIHSAASFFDELKRNKGDMLTKNMLNYIDNLLDGFDDASADMDPIALTELEASDVNISDVVQFQDVLGHGMRNCGIP